MRLIMSLIAVFALAMPAAAQQFTNSPLSCMRLPGMVKVLNKVVQETQIHPLGNYRASSDVLRGQGDCTYVYNRPFTTDRYEAVQNGVFGAQNLGGFFGWIVTDRWLVPVEQAARLDKAKEKFFRPAALYDRRRFTLPRRCFRYDVKMQGVQIVGHQLDYRGRKWCRRPILK